MLFMLNIRVYPNFSLIDAFLLKFLSETLFTLLTPLFALFQCLVCSKER